MERRTISASMLRLAVVGFLALGAVEVALLAADQNKAADHEQPVPPAVARCTAMLAASPLPAKPDEPPAGPAAASPAQSATPATASTSSGASARLYMPDGQLVSHGLTIYVTADLHASEDLQLRLFRNHAITDVSAGEEQPLMPALVASGQEWSETFQGRQIYPKGTLLIFDTSSMSFDGRAMARVRPLLTWKDGGVERCAVGAGEVNVGDIVFAMAWTVTAIVVAVLLVVLLALTKRNNPMRFMTGVDGHLALSQAQIACWTVFVGSVVLGYGLIRRTIPDIPESLLVLMGASLATGGLAYFQDAKKATAAAATGTPIPGRSWAWGDLIHTFPPDREPELSLAKAQMLFWTLLLLVLFVSKSILEGQIWAVPWPLVALMGFSQVGYLAPKVANADAPTSTATAAGSPAVPAPPATVPLTTAPTPSSAGQPADGTVPPALTQGG